MVKRVTASDREL